MGQAFRQVEPSDFPVLTLVIANYTATNDVQIAYRIMVHLKKTGIQVIYVKRSYRVVQKR
jgi:hypothetical protein